MLVFDDPCPGALKTATTEENETKIHNIILSACWLKVHDEIAAIICISEERILYILHEILGMRELSARWVPRFLTADNKWICVTRSQQCLELFNHNPKEYNRRRNMDSLLHSRNQGAVKTKDLARWTCSEEGEDCPVGRKDRILKVWFLLTIWRRENRCRTIEIIWRRVKRKTAPFISKKCAFLLR